MKPKLICNLKKDRWVSLNRVREFTLSQTRNGWSVIVYIDPHDCFVCKEFNFRKEAEDWLGMFNE